MDHAKYLSTVRDAGAKAAEAQYRRDQSGVNWQYEQAGRIYRMFRGGDQYALRKAFDDSYRETFAQLDPQCRPA